MAKKIITCKTCGAEGSITAAKGQIVCTECGPVLANVKDKSNEGEMKMQGHCKWFSSEKGFGFIMGEDSTDYFVHQTQIKMPGFRVIYADQTVEFTPSTNDKGNTALEVVPGPVPEEEPKSFRNRVVNKGA